MRRTSTIPNEYSQFFIEFSASCIYPVLDIGAAFGVASIPALLEGATVIANDIDKKHLEILKSSVPKHLNKNLLPIIGKFPYDFDFPDNSLGAVHASNLLNFLTGDEIIYGLKKIFHWLDRNGKLFIIAATPYANNIKEFIPIFESRKRMGVLWPGEATNLKEICDHPTLYELPNFIHLLDQDTLQKLLEMTGFIIERIEMYKRDNLPNYIALDGRENLGVIAFKP